MSKLPASIAIVAEAIRQHKANTGRVNREIAADIGFDKPNYITMLSKTDRIGLARIKAFKRAVPEVNEHLLTAAVISELVESPEAEDAVIELARFINEPLPFELSLMYLANEVRESDEKSGLTIPDSLPEDIEAKIKALLHEAVQRTTRKQHDV